MRADLQEQACWLLLVCESGLPRRVVNTILAEWCKQLGRSLQEFFAADVEEWQKISLLKPEMLQKLEQAREKLTGQAFLVEQLLHEQIEIVTVLDARYPRLLKVALGLGQLPSILFAQGDLAILERRTVAIIGSRNAHPASLAFTQAVAGYFSSHDMNVISGNAKGVDRSALEGVMHAHGYTTVVLPHGIHKLSKVQMSNVLPGIEDKQVLLLSQFPPNAPWLVSRAMERNHVVTGLAQTVVVAEADSKGGTWEGANNALRQGRRLYVCQHQDGDSLPGNKLLIEKGGYALSWPAENLDELLLPLVKESDDIQNKQQRAALPPNQLSLLALPEM